MSLSQGVVLTLTEAIGDLSFKQEALGKGAQWAAIGFVGYAGLAMTLRSMLLEGTKLSILNGFWDASSSIFTYLTAWLYFNEQITPLQHLGFAMSVVATYLLREI